MTIIITPDVRTAAYSLLAHLDARCARKRAGDEEVARLVGLTIAEFDADTTAPDPDPGAEEEQEQ